MRVRYSMVDGDGYQAECDLSEKKAHSLFEKLREDKHCVWAELIAEDEEEYTDSELFYDENADMEILDDFYHEDAYDLYKEELKVRKVFEELFG